MEAKLHAYQVVSKNFLLQNKRAGLFLDMGLGKSLITLTALEELLSLYGEENKILIIAPLSVARGTWAQEAAKWNHLNHLTFSLVLGSSQQRLNALEKKADIYLTNRENVVWLTEHYKKKWPFQTVIVDELSSFKSASAQRFRALKRVLPFIDRFIGLTGTPAPNGLVDLWAQIYLMDKGERLGSSVTSYKYTYFQPAKQNGHIVYSWALKEGSEEAIYTKISDIVLSMKAVDYLELPERVDIVKEIELSEKETKLYKQLEREYVLELDEATITAGNAAVKTGKLLQLANGAVYDEDKKVLKIHDRKLDALEQILEEANGQPVLVFYNFISDCQRIQERFPQALKLDIKRGDLEKWNKGEISLLLAHPASAGHGLNLQKGGNLLVWFGMPWSLELYQQANARLHRQGQKNCVRVIHLCAKGTADETVMASLSQKDTTQEALLAALKAKIIEIRK